MSKHLIFNAFGAAAANHVSPGFWKLPEARIAREYTKPAFWIELAKTLDDAGFDTMFWPDILGVGSDYRGTTDSAFETAQQAPNIDPMPLAAMLASHTKNIGFAVTVSTTYSHPFQVARQMATLDHLTDGRIGWNVVTSSSDAAARNHGLEYQIPHDERYVRAEEYMEVVYKLWEQSWPDAAVVMDVENDVYAEGSRIRPINHHGHYYRVDGPLPVPPSPQRTPVLFQAGSSRAGLEFAARNTEVMFLAGNKHEQVRDERLRILENAAAVGRRPGDLRFVSSLTFVTGTTNEEAQAKYDRWAAAASFEGGLTQLSLYTGIDWSKYDLDSPILDVSTEGMQSVLSELAADAGAGSAWTVRDAAKYIAIGGMRPTLVGDGNSIADQIEEAVEVSGVDGFNLLSLVTPTAWEDFIREVMPELERRGLRPTREEREANQARTLRGRIFGSDRLPANHPAAQFQRA
jgi:long-chain alkane monooxygenase